MTKLRGQGVRGAATPLPPGHLSIQLATPWVGSTNAPLGAFVLSAPTLNSVGTVGAPINGVGTVGAPLNGVGTVGVSPLNGVGTVGAPH